MYIFLNCLLQFKELGAPHLNLIMKASMKFFNQSSEQFSVENFVKTTYFWERITVEKEIRHAT